MPVVAVGLIVDPWQAEAVLWHGDADLVSTRQPRACDRLAEDRFQLLGGGAA